MAVTLALFEPGPLIALGEKLATLQPPDLSEDRASRAELDRYRATLSKVPDVPGASGDGLYPSKMVFRAMHAPRFPETPSATGI